MYATPCVVLLQRVPLRPAVLLRRRLEATPHWVHITLGLVGSLVLHPLGRSLLFRTRSPIHGSTAHTTTWGNRKRLPHTHTRRGKFEPDGTERNNAMAATVVLRRHAAHMT